MKPQCIYVQGRLRLMTTCRLLPASMCTVYFLYVFLAHAAYIVCKLFCSQRDLQTFQSFSSLRLYLLRWLQVIRDCEDASLRAEIKG